MTECEMAGCHHWLDGCEFEQALGVGDGQGRLACCSTWGHEELYMTEWLQWTELNWYMKIPKIPSKIIWVICNFNNFAK